MVRQPNKVAETGKSARNHRLKRLLRTHLFNAGLQGMEIIQTQLNLRLLLKARFLADDFDRDDFKVRSRNRQRNARQTTPRTDVGDTLEVMQSRQHRQGIEQMMRDRLLW